MLTLRKVRLFLRAFFSRRLRKLKAKRDEICKKCDKGFYTAYHTGLGRRVRVGLFCGECGCQAWRGSDINKNKNIYEDMVCPLRLWPGDKARKDAIDLHQATQLLQARNKAQRNEALALAVIDGDISLDDRICSELGVQTAEQRRAQKRAEQQASPHQQSAPQRTAQAAIDAMMAAQQGKAPAGVVAADNGKQQANESQAIPANRFAQAFPNDPPTSARHSTSINAGRRALAAATSQNLQGAGT